MRSARKSGILKTPTMILPPTILPKWNLRALNTGPQQVARLPKYHSMAAPETMKLTI